MSDPFEILGLAADAGDDEIRQQYLQLVREFPPDRAPERFAEIRAAYDELRDPLRQLEKQMFSLETHDSFEALARDIRKKILRADLPAETLLSLAELS
ncbi:MAG TPA: DnaJ domain-containing protein [Planctomycetaceae bacterium]|jgi:curved DNA-binding protein CbpA